jgi:hypothetical protein
MRLSFVLFLIHFICDFLRLSIDLFWYDFLLNWMLLWWSFGW